MKRVLMIVAARGFDDAEVRTLREILEPRGVEITLASIASQAIGMRKQYRVDKLVSQAHIGDFDGLIVVGGQGARDLWGHRDVMQLVGGAALQHKPLALSGMAAPIAAQATLLVDADATCAHEEEVILEMQKHRARFVNLPLVETNGVITSCGVDAAEELAYRFGARLGETPVAQPSG
jgi:protease I